MNLFPSSVEIKSFRQESGPLAPVTSDFAPLVWDRPVYFRFHLISLPGPPWSLHTAETGLRERTGMERWEGTPEELKGSAHVWSGVRWRRFSLQ